MKHTSYILGAFLLATATLTSCVDDTPLSFEVDKPASIVNMEYLNQYDALKTYLTDPNFKLGVGVDAATYSQQGFMNRVINTNFNEVVAGNAMKYASVVANNGSMDFSNVSSFVTAAKEAGMSVYGHTLVWHAQQNLRYLNNLLVDIPIPGGDGGVEQIISLQEDFETGYSAMNGWGNGSSRQIVDGAMEITNPSVVNPWEAQVAYDFGTPFEIGVTYYLSLRVKGTVEGSMSPQFQNPNTYSSCGDFQSVPITTEWADVKVSTTCVGENAARFLFSLGAYAGTIYIDEISIYQEKEQGGEMMIPQYVTDEDFSSGEVMNGWGNNSSRQVVDGVLEITNPAAANYWDAQAAIDYAEQLEPGRMYYTKMRVKGSVPGLLRVGFQNPETYGGCGDFSPIELTTDWVEVTRNTTISAENAKRFIFSFGDYAGTIYIDYVQLYWEKSLNAIEQTPEEKADTLTWALNNWVAGMMTATDGYVTAWDVVNEPLSGGDGDGDGLYDLQSATNGDATTNFYWQDYLGENYVRTAVRLARENSTVPLKLFVNDYNLESDWDDNGKLKSLIKWIERWEEDGTVIDGIGTQMHVSYYLDPTTQASKQAAITKMFELLAETGKLIKISELDMGIVDTNGKDILTPAVTDDQAKGMAQFYHFIIKEYLRLIPATQRYGITQWAATDSDTDSGWRAGQPIGLWTLNYESRKHAYGGFADGLAGVAYPSKQ
ncbi:MAG: endo-1,4-beta-xylanase [Prevotellaceae bacterium]|jgi:GH35 family endo-1,4-beta-xylanase|nr:endo-1,4-beta-xylanase [Prevotellaceae bacterium]